MYIWPVGVNSCNPHMFWPLWEAVLLRRYGRARLCACPPSVWPAALYWSLWLESSRRLALICPPDPEVFAAAGESPASRQPPQLDLLWPSDEPPDATRIVVVERWLREPDPMPGQLVDLLY